MWKFDLETEKWEAVQISGKAPEPRSGAASTAIGDRLGLFGGEGESELYADLYIYDNISGEWSQIAADGLPSARKHACMSSYYPYLYLFGGITQNGYSDEVWKIDIKNFASQLLSSGNPSGPLPSAFSGCHVEEDGGEIMFYVYTGETEGETPLDGVFKLQTNGLIWTSLGPLTLRSQSSTVKVMNRILVVAGEQWGLDAHNTVYMMDTDTTVVSQLASFPSSIYSAASRYYKTAFYIFGGGDKFGEKFRSSVPVHNFYKLELNVACGEFCNWQCSPGTHLTSSGSCEACPEGTYSDLYGLSYCKACPLGTFSKRKGNSSLRQCYPCEEGFYNPLAGSRMCLGCPSGYFCEVGSSVPSLSPQSSAVVSNSQPDLFVPGTEKVDSFSVQLQNGFIGLGMLTMMLIFIFKQRIYNFVSSLDLFDDLHNHEDDVPITKHKNFFGGFFSLLFYVCVTFYLIVAFLVYAWDNVEEIKALVPLVTLEKEYNDVRLT